MTSTVARGSLSGKTAVVTGAARGIGLAYCERLAREGASVVALDLDDPSDRVASLAGGGRKIGYACDVGNPGHITSVADAVLEEFGRCDILVNNAATFPTGELTAITVGMWDRVQAVNVRSVLLLAQAFAPGMRAAGWGRIVNTGSANTLLHGRDLAYITSKGAVHTITRALANELGVDGITVNAIAPSVVATEGFLTRSRDSGPPAQEVLAQVVALQTIKRPSVPADLANALAWLVSDDANFVTGQILHVDGGLTRSGA